MHAFILFHFFPFFLGARITRRHSRLAMDAATSNPDISSPHPLRRGISGGDPPRTPGTASFMALHFSRLEEDRITPHLGSCANELPTIGGALVGCPTPPMVIRPHSWSQRRFF
ncbi:uncharacterized protein LY79DRAFT_569850 [Colletotrichum navitas]|uniref:Secreted protein n=1 Tax=Colletotrichum navitas TaxID=681940 RepID=A0AAD8V011_9PEZI|nr:uncharacterized protein LY79DRAFT_569850 [Colletotrichum navitas]KAK1572730.1 hypothetical protein LY79DRAFT_569850 [Colletotrichum navitas]